MDGHTKLTVGSAMANPKIRQHLYLLEQLHEDPSLSPQNQTKFKG